MTEPTKKSDAPLDTEALLSALSALESTLVKASREVDSTVAPVRESFVKRFPVLFLLLTTIGATAVFLSLEKILLSIDLFDTQPWILFALGVGILAVTGRLTKIFK